MWAIWLILAGFFLILETITTGFLVFWFGVAAGITALLSLIVASKVIQTAIFLVLSIALLFATKPFAEKLAEKEKNVKTNAFSITGKTGKVLVDISPDDETGLVKIGTEKWSAKSIDNSFIDKDTIVRVVRIDGVKAIVEPIEKI